MSKISQNKKQAVVLFNLGGPDNLQAVKPFLFNLFNDKYIISLPTFFRYILAWIISTLRNKKAQKIYEMMGGGSTILAETKQQANKLKEKLLSLTPEKEIEVFICMRHWHPMTEEVIDKIEKYSPDEIILLPLYPQFSTTTTGSSVEYFLEKQQKSSLKNVVVKTICCYPTERNFIKSHVKKIKQQIKGLDNYRILFSAHGLPKKIIDNGDPYQNQIEKSVEEIVRSLGDANLDYLITYQSKVGPMQWLEPNTEDEILNGAKTGKNLVVVPIAFVSEHSETLVELDIEYKELIKDYNIQYKRIATLSDDDLYISSLAQMVQNSAVMKNGDICSADLKKICSGDFSNCPCKVSL